MVVGWASILACAVCASGSRCSAGSGVSIAAPDAAPESSLLYHFQALTKEAQPMKASQSIPQRSGLARVIIADDHELARAGLRSMLAGDRGLELVGEATNGHEAVALCRQLQPDLAVLDVRMPEMD